VLDDIKYLKSAFGVEIAEVFKEMVDVLLNAGLFQRVIE
jgi:hypothetical protein